MSHSERPPLELDRPVWGRLAASPSTMAVAVAALAAAILCVSLQRTFLGTGVETDFSSLFAQETLRLFRGEPLEMLYHPPGFSFVLALGRLIGDVSWLTTGLWITGLSVVVVVAASIATWRRLAGDAAAWGAIAALASSIPFRVSASVASSDMFFTALVCVLLLLIVTALQSPRRTAVWAACGAMAACVFLTRTNGLVAVIVLAMPLLVASADANRAKNVAAVAIAFLLPIAAWALFAWHTNSPFMPVKNHLNIAVAVFGEGNGKWGEQMQRLEPIMRNMADVLRYDPPRLIAVLARNLATLPYYIMRSLVWPPLALLAVPGLFMLLRKRCTPALLICLGFLAAMTALSGIMEFVARFFLVLIPAIGAMAGVAFKAGLDRLAIREKPRLATSGAAVLVMIAVSAWSHTQVLPRIESGPVTEFAEAAAQVRSLTERDARVYSRSASMVLESGRRVTFLATFESLDQFREAFCRDAGGPTPSYLYLGSLEREFRGALSRELTAQEQDWLEPVARGTTTDWTLYRILFDQSSAASCSSSSAT